VSLVHANEFKGNSMRKSSLVMALMLCCGIGAAEAQVSVGFSVPGVSFGINMPTYPNLVPVPGYPVYYDPQASANYFFYDGMYWVLANDNWYASTWYNGPWELVAPDAVPLFILRVPVRYYREPPAYFHGWSANDAPRWGDHWGNSWQQSHNGWDNWNHSSIPARAPLPVYQRQYSGNRYPQGEQQQALNSQNYHYQPHDAVVQRSYPAQQAKAAPVNAPKPTQANHTERAPAPQAAHPPVQAAEHATPENPPMKAEHPAKQPPLAATQAPHAFPEAGHEPKQSSVTAMQAQHTAPQVAHPAKPPAQAAMQHEQHVPTNTAHAAPEAPKNLAQHEQQAPKIQAPKAPVQEKPRVAEKPPQEAPKASEKVSEHGDKGDHG
jgi:hypothetical protein